MTNETIMFNRFEQKTPVTIDTLPAGIAYISNSSDRALCMSLDDAKAVRFLSDAGEVSVCFLDMPAKAQKILGKVVGIVVEKQFELHPRKPESRH